MSCRKATRELLERFRFGEELGEESAPHLEHLRTCAACREEIGLDRTLVRHLQEALRQRVAGAAPPETAWLGIRARLHSPVSMSERLREAFSIIGRPVELAARLRTSMAVVVVLLAILVLPAIRAPQPSSSGAGASRLTHQRALFETAWVDPSAAPAPRRWYLHSPGPPQSGLVPSAWTNEVARISSAQPVLTGLVQ